MRAVRKENIKKSGACADTGEIFYIPPYLIKPNHSLARTEFHDTSLCSLADSIRRHGMLQPLAVCLSEDGRYELIAGERRLRAAVLLRLSVVPCVMVENISDNDLAQYISIVENLQREKLNMFDEARAIRRLAERSGKAETARLLSIGVSELERKLSLASFSRAEMQEILSLGISERRAALFLDMPKSVRYYAIKLCSEADLSDSLVSELCTRLACVENPSPDGLSDIISELKKGIYTACDEKKTGKDAEEKNDKTKIILHDLGVFEVSLEKACDILRRAGLFARLEKVEKDSETVYTVTVGKTEG